MKKVKKSEKLKNEKFTLEGVSSFPPPTSPQSLLEGAPSPFFSKKIIAIDPDFRSNGIAFWHNSEINVQTLDFFETLKMIDNSEIVIIEKCWNSPHIFTRKKGLKIAMEIARRVGMNHTIGILLFEYAKKQKKQVFLLMPLKRKSKNDKETALNLLLYFFSNQKNYVSQLMEFPNGRNSKI